MLKFSRAALAVAILVCATPLAAHAAAKSGDKRFTFTDSLPSFTPPAGRGLICLVRETRARAVSMKPERLYLDGAPLGYLAQLSYVLVDVAPGLHRLEGVGGPPPLVLSVAPGELRLLRLREVIDLTDRMVMHWILDAPDNSRDLVTSTPLARSRVTAAGLADLRKKQISLAGAAPPDSIVPPLDDRTVVKVANIWFEHPLDQLNLRRDFSIYSGTLELGADSFEYDMQKKRREVHVEIPYARIERIQYGGTRAVGLSPWIDVFYRADDELLWRASFADASAEGAEANYNRLFALISARRAARLATAGADTADTARAGGEPARTP